MSPLAPKSHPPGEYDRCPRCSGAEIHAFYTDPCQYECQSCGATWDGPGMRVLTPEESKAKRPEMYHLCGWCGHHIRNGATPAQESAGAWSRGSCGAGVEPGRRLVAGLLVDECYAFDDRSGGKLRGAGPPIILGSDARDVPTPGGIPADVAAPMGFIYVPEGET